MIDQPCEKQTRLVYCDVPLAVRERNQLVCCFRPTFAVVTFPAPRPQDVFNVHDNPKCLGSFMYAVEFYGGFQKTSHVRLRVSVRRCGTLWCAVCAHDHFWF